MAAVLCQRALMTAPSVAARAVQGLRLMDHGFVADRAARTFSDHRLVRLAAADRRSLGAFGPFLMDPRLVVADRLSIGAFRPFLMDPWLVVADRLSIAIAITRAFQRLPHNWRVVAHRLLDW